MGDELKPKQRFTTEELQEKIEKVWPTSALSLYFAQVLSGECSIQGTIEDILSLDK